MSKPQVTTWSDAPELAIPEMPAILSESSDLWLAYETTSAPRGQVYAVIRFRHVIDHRLSPINDEGLGQHPYATVGLRWYSFNEIRGSQETARWSALNARHWVITFKDATLDVVAKDAEVIANDLQTTSPLAALLSVVRGAKSTAHGGPR